MRHDIAPQRALRRIVAPSVEPVTLAEAKLHCRVDIDDDDTLISSLITAAREWCEAHTLRAFVRQTWKLTLDRFPGPLGYPYPEWSSFGDEPIELPQPPLFAVSSVQYVDTAGTLQSLTDYRLDSENEPARITPAYGETWPATRAQMNAVTIVYEAGYPEGQGSPSDQTVNVPQSVKQAMLLLIGHWYEHRESASDFTILEVPQTVTFILAPLRVHRF